MTSFGFNGIYEDASASQTKFQVDPQRESQSSEPPFKQFVPLYYSFAVFCCCSSGLLPQSALLQHLKSVNFTLLCCCRFFVYWVILFLVHNMAICSCYHS